MTLTKEHRSEQEILSTAYELLQVSPQEDGHVQKLFKELSKHLDLHKTTKVHVDKGSEYGKMEEDFLSDWLE